MAWRRERDGKEANLIPSEKTQYSLRELDLQDVRSIIFTENQVQVVFSDGSERSFMFPNKQVLETEIDCWALKRVKRARAKKRKTKIG